MGENICPKCGKPLLPGLCAHNTDSSAFVSQVGEDDICTCGKAVSVSKNLNFLTFDFLRVHATHSIDLADSLLIGGFAGSVMEIIGRMLFYPKEDKVNSADRIYRFIKDYLSKEDTRYETYKENIYSLFRNGGAHCILPKGGINITGDPSSERFHLHINRDANSLPLEFYWFTIYLPKFKTDLKNAIIAFVTDAEKYPSLENNYSAVIKNIVKEGNVFLREKVNKGEYKVDSEYINLKGDIKL